MKFTKSQEKVLAELPSWFYTHSNVAILEARAGSGKTFLIKHFLDSMGKRIKPLILAETNEATNVLKISLGSKYLEVTKTICSAFNLTLGNVEGVKKLVQHAEPSFKEVNLIVIDEASMISSSRLNMILQSCIAEDVKVLF